MKKLLALILCVVMVLSLAPAAFAANYNNGATALDPDYQANITPVWQAKADAKKAVKQASESMQTVYASLAADQGVFGTITAMDSVIDGLSKGLFEDIDEIDLKLVGGINKITGDDAADATKDYLRAYVGGEILKYMSDHIGSYAKYDNGAVVGIKPEKYLATFATAATKALNSEKAQKNIEAVVYGLALAKTLKDVSDAQDDLYAEMQEWVADNTDFDAYGFNALTDPSVVAWKPLALLDADAINMAGDTELNTFVNAWLGYADN